MTHRGRTLLGPSPISMTLLDGRVLGRAARVTGTRSTQVIDSLRPVVAIKNATIRDRYAQVRVDFRGGYAVEARAYDEGVAYRWVTRLPTASTDAAEQATFALAGTRRRIIGIDSTFMTHQEPA